MTALSKRKDKEEISLIEYQQGISNLLSMAVLRDKAPVWAAAGIAAITRPRQRDASSPDCYAHIHSYCGPLLMVLHN